MERRSFLALLATGVAGCSSTGQPTPTARDTRTETPTATATRTQTATATETPTRTATETPTAAEVEARAAIDEVRSTLHAAIRRYRGAGETILATDAATAGFDDRHIQQAVAEAGREIETAAAETVTERGERAVDRLDTMRLFLRTATETQVALIGAYYRLEEARDAFEATSASAADRAVERMDVQRQIARAPYATLVAETSAGATVALPEFDASTYRAKREQFDAEIRAFGRLYGPLDRFASGVGQLEAALALRRNGSTAEAERAAERAAAQFDSASSSLASLADSFGTPADSLGGMTRQLRSIAATKATTTRDRDRPVPRRDPVAPADRRPDRPASLDRSRELTAPIPNRLCHNRGNPAVWQESRPKFASSTKVAT